jgi:hypothetical protein
MFHCGEKVNHRREVNIKRVTDARNIILRAGDENSSAIFMPFPSIGAKLIGKLKTKSSNTQNHTYLTISKMFGDWGKKAYEWAGFANPKQSDEAR